jgi:hypothetical protein
MTESEIIALLYAALKNLPPLQWEGMAGFSFDGDNNSCELIIDDAEGKSFVISSAAIKTVTDGSLSL